MDAYRHHWTYTDDAPGHQQRWERFFDDCRDARIAPKYVPTGGSGPEESSIVLYANKAKARRLAARLDSWLGTDGQLTPLAREY